MEHAAVAAKKLDCANIAELTRKASLPGKFNIPGPNRFLSWHGYTLMGTLDVLCVHSERPQENTNGSEISGEVFDVLVRHISSGTIVSIMPNGNDYLNFTVKPASGDALKMFKTFFQQDEPIDDSKLPADPAGWLAFYRSKF